MIKFTRTAHAIGQGGFYSECFEINDKDRFRLVYDCGSETLVPTSKSNKTNFRKIINSDLCKPANSPKNDIDVLVVSHFHADHINGIEFLNPRYIVIPLLTEEQLLMLWVYAAIHDIDFALGLENNLRGHFPQAQIIGVKQMEDEEYPANENNLNNNNYNHVIASHDPLPKFALNSIDSFWEYRFYNPNLNKFLHKFKNELVIKGLDFDKLKGLGSKTYIELHRDDLKAIYSSIGNINEHSLLMYSNAKLGSIKDIYFRAVYQSRNADLAYRWCPLHRKREHVPYSPGGFYWGDIAVTDSLKSKLNSYLKHLSPVSFIQVPHHGSHYNFKVSILDSSIYKVSRPLLCVIQAGTINKYGHPSANVISKIIGHKEIPIIVTEDRSSCFIQSFDFII